METQGNKGRALRLSDASRRLGVPYRRAFEAVAAGLIPAHRDAGGARWLIAEGDLPEIARALGVEFEAGHAAGR